MEKISVIVPVYNIENYLKRVLDCLVNQTYKNIEIILVDDGSTDQSGKICDEYQKNDERIKVIHQKNSGVSVARNVGVRAATGQYLGFVDSDDVISLEMYEVLYKNMFETSSDVSVCNYRSFTDCEPKFIMTNNEIVNYSKMDVLKDIISDGKITNFLWNKLFKKELFDDIIFPEGKIYEDMYVLPRIFERVNRVCYTEMELYGYYQRSNSYVNSYSISKNDNYLEFVEDIYQYLSKYQELGEVLKAYRCFGIYSAFLQAAKSRCIDIIKSERMNNELKKFRNNFKVDKKITLKRRMLYYILLVNKMLFYKIVILIK